MKALLLKAALATAVGLSWAGMAHGAERTATLLVDDMTCVSCPYMVERSLKQIDGVIDARASMDTGTAEVTFDDERVDAEILTRATADAGFPSRLKE